MTSLMFRAEAKVDMNFPNSKCPSFGERGETKNENHQQQQGNVLQPFLLTCSHKTVDLLSVRCEVVTSITVANYCHRQMWYDRKDNCRTETALDRAAEQRWSGLACESGCTSRSPE